MLIQSCLLDTVYAASQRLLKGHPNIVHLIDAAWHKMPNGLYEVFILMEFCAGNAAHLYLSFVLISYPRWRNN
jgi:hypothetical protein